jgi:hypothetical protein
MILVRIDHPFLRVGCHNGLLHLVPRCMNELKRISRGDELASRVDEHSPG